MPRLWVETRDQRHISKSGKISPLGLLLPFSCHSVEEESLGPRDSLGQLRQKHTEWAPGQPTTSILSIGTQAPGVRAVCPGQDQTPPWKSPISDAFRVPLHRGTKDDLGHSGLWLITKNRRATEQVLSEERGFFRFCTGQWQGSTSPTGALLATSR